MKITSPSQWKKELARLWPPLKGSLALVYKPCIRPNCPACRRGDKHPAWLLSYSEKGNRRCLYVPLAMVATIKRALKNGRRIEELLSKMGPALIQEYRQGLKKSPKPRSKS